MKYFLSLFYFSLSYFFSFSQANYIFKLETVQIVASDYSNIASLDILNFSNSECVHLSVGAENFINFNKINSFPSCAGLFINQEKGILYPNPATEQVVLKIGGIRNQSEIIKLIIMDYNGRTYLNKSQPFLDYYLKINISSLHSGVYFLQIVFADNKIDFYKFLKL